MESSGFKREEEVKNNKHADRETAADIMNDDTTDKIAMLNEMHPMNPDERRDYLEYAINKKNNKNFETSPLTSRSIQYDGWNSTEWFETGIHGDDVKREVHGSRVESMWIYLISWTIIAAFFFALILLLVSSSSDSTEIIASFAFIWIIGYCIALVYVYTRAMGRNKYDYTNAHAYDGMNDDNDIHVIIVFNVFNCVHMISLMV